MNTYLDFFRNKILNCSLEDSVKGIEELIIISNQISDIFLECLKTRAEHFVITEKISPFLYSYLGNLKSLVKTNDPDLSFWAATLIMSYNINDIEAEKNLLNTISSGPIEKATIATTILSRIGNVKVSHAISVRLSDKFLSEEFRGFFLEKLNDSKEFTR
jgi:hypothetical protein